MSEQDAPEPGSIPWRDLTVPDASALRDFYAAVAGWRAQPVAMDGYDDWCMLPQGSDVPVAGICHARGPNAALPPQWLLYVVVDDVAARAARAVELGGALLDGPRSAGGGTMAVVRDPAGACIALWRPDR